MGGDATFEGRLTMKVMRADGRVEYHGPEVPAVLDKAWRRGKRRLARLVRRQRRFVEKARALGIVTITSKLTARKWNHALQRWEDYGLVGMRSVTNAGVEFLVDDWDDDSENITLMNFHDSGIGVAAEDVTDIDLGTPAGPTARATGTKTQAVANALETVATITYTSTLAISEHGVFNDSVRGAPDNLWDRTLLPGVINVVNNDAIQFTYTCTVNAGG